MDMFLFTSYVHVVLVHIACCITQKAHPNDINCGHPAISPRTKRIVGGTEAVIGSWPWMAMLEKDGEQACGGSIINEYFILTAAHCFNGSDVYDVRKWLAYVGKHHVHVPDAEQSLHHIEKIIIHEGFNSTSLRNDIALLLLLEPIRYQAHVLPVCIPSTVKRIVPFGMSCYATGWGKTLGRESRQVLNQVPLPIIRPFYCGRSDWYGSRFIPNLTFCAGYVAGGRDSCTGDSGGPFVCNVRGTWYQLGVVSWGDDCAMPQQPGIYTDVSRYGDWIRNHSQYLGHFGKVMIG